VASANGLIYGIPSYSEFVMIIDPADDTADVTTITGLIGTNKWRGGVEASNGKVRS
jgi:hypothetical protein